MASNVREYLGSDVGFWLLSIVDYLVAFCDIWVEIIKFRHKRKYRCELKSPPPHPSSTPPPGEDWTPSSWRRGLGQAGDTLGSQVLSWKQGMG